MIGGVFLAYIGATIRWLFGKRDKSIKELFYGDSTMDIYSNVVDGWLNRLIGIGTILVLLLIIYLITKGVEVSN